MTQASLWRESLKAAMESQIDGCGGPKKVGTLLRPSMSAEDARRWVSKCLEPTRREAFNAADVVQLLQLGRKHGCHVLADYLMRDAGYEPPRPIDLAVEVERVAGTVGEQVATIRATMERLTRLVEIIGPAKG